MWLRFVCLGLLALCITNCAAYSTKRQRLVDQVARGDYDQALKTVDKLQHGKPNLLDLMDRGMVLHLRGDFAASNLALEAAEKRIDELFAVSISREAATYLVNDLTQAYAGEEFERSYVNLLMAFNYVGLGKFEDALVEARKIDQRLAVYARAYAGKSRYLNHALAHYLSGLLHDAGGDLNDARISYYKALQGYADYEKFYGIPTPSALKRDFLCAAKNLGIIAEYDRFRQFYFPQSGEPDCRRSREIVVFFNFGRIAHKEERYWGIPTPTGPVLKIAYPVYRSTPSAISGAAVVLPGAAAVPMTPIEDLSRLARKTLAERIVAIKARATERALLKAGASAAAGVAVAQSTDDEALGALVAILTNSLLGYTERADTRSWLTLPAAIHMARIPVQSGESTVTLRLSYYGSDGQSDVGGEDLTVPIATDAEKTFVFFRAKEPWAGGP